MTTTEINTDTITRFLDFIPTQEQSDVLERITAFLNSGIHNTFILKGAAGTGKTSILKAVVNYLKSEQQSYELLAPTGRAASIISAKTGFSASTIHSHMYRVKEVKDSDGNILYIEFVRKNNYNDKPKVYLIDESSMVGDTINKQEYFVSKKPVLEDLITFIHKGNNDNKIIFVGDPYQLPPVNSVFSPALSKDYLQSRYGLKITGFELTEVKRQENDSYILDNAINLRNCIKNNFHPVFWKYEQSNSEDDAITQYCDDIKNGKADKSIFLAWKNISINNLNERIRTLLNYNTNVIVPGERLILNQSNYAGIYLSSGTFLVVDKVIQGVEEIAELRFITVTLRQSDTGELLPGTFKIDINSLLSDNGRTDSKQTKRLWHERYRVNKELRKTKDIRSDEYLSALKVRYGYAITTHKSQGGEWDNVYLYPEIPFGTNGLRWLYTSITRARKHLFSFQ